MALNYEHKILDLLSKRASGKTICPSEILESEQKTNTALMAKVREAAISLAQKEKIVITQKGERIEPHNIKGPIRLKLKE